MEKIVVEGGYPLNGEVNINGSKNAALAVLVGACLGEEPCRIENVPRYTDIFDIIEILNDSGAKVEWVNENALVVDGHGLYNPVASYELVRKLRGSFYVAGLLLSKLGSRCRSNSRAWLCQSKSKKTRRDNNLCRTFKCRCYS